MKMSEMISRRLINYMNVKMFPRGDHFFIQKHYRKAFTCKNKLKIQISEANSDDKTKNKHIFLFSPYTKVPFRLFY